MFRCVTGLRRPTRRVSLIEYRQAELQLEQLYTQIHMQVVAQLFALTNDRAQVQASVAAQEYARPEPGRGTEEAGSGRFDDRHWSCCRNATWRWRRINLINANATYAKDRALLYQVLRYTLQHYGINMNDAATGEVKNRSRSDSGVQPAKDKRVAPTTPPPSSR